MSTTGFVTDDGIRLHYEERGRGDVSVIYLHWMGGNTGTWRELWNALEPAARCRHIALDLRGHGRSHREPCRFTHERLARDVLNLADHLGLTRFAVVGHSGGGKLALYLAAMAPARISQLVLLGPVGPGQVPLERTAVDNALQRAHELPFVREFFRLWFQIWPREALDQALESFTRTPKWALRAACETTLWTDFSQEIAPLPHPTLLIAGAQDPLYGPAYQRVAVLPFLPHTRLIAIPACGHGLLLERPREIAGACAAFLAPSPAEPPGAQPARTGISPAISYHA